ncbi:hypothetical protein SS50377_28299 [Spironucleus salmonicida]|uniref:Uncharacterized protein n=1 Tax=Spironucleus salmonicida TaxID=348837 RepID=V6LSW0_9EUKA|nr:hypothetical protein SS50377_28299 [Spironucleus salmonicida]|eukprot:EST46781.1 Hypothetical protein SS50377_13180 [Spironucleus salmonicida]
MKIKCLLPIPNRGLTVHNVPSNKSFYQLFEAELATLDIRKHVLTDSYGKPFSVSQPLCEIGAYPGISFELKLVPEVEKGAFQIRAHAGAALNFKVNLTEFGMLNMQICADRHAILKNLLMERKIEFDFDSIDAVYQKCRFSLNSTLSGMNLQENAEIYITRRLLPQEYCEQSADITNRDLVIFAAERAAWSEACGADKLTTPEERRELYLARARAKGVLKIKLIQNALRCLKIVEMDPLGTQFDLVMRVRAFVASRCTNLDEEETAVLISEMEVRKGVSGMVIDPNQCELFELFNEADGTVQIVCSVELGEVVEAKMEAAEAVDNEQAQVVVVENKFGSAGRKL